MKKYKNIKGYKINVSNKQVQPNEIIEVNEKAQEIINLVSNNYLEEVK